MSEREREREREREPSSIRTCASPRRRLIYCPEKLQLPSLPPAASIGRAPRDARPDSSYARALARAPLTAVTGAPLTTLARAPLTALARAALTALARAALTAVAGALCSPGIVGAWRPGDRRGSRYVAVATHYNS